MDRRSFFQIVLGGALASRLRASVATEHFSEWYEAKSSIESFVSEYFRVKGSDGKAKSVRSHQWLGMLGSNDIGSRFLLKLQHGDEFVTALAAVAAHRLVFFSDVHVGLLGSGNVPWTVADQVIYALNALPDWMLMGNAKTTIDGVNTPNGNQLTVFSDPRRRHFSDLFISEADRISPETIKESVLAASGGCVLMTTEKHSYRPPVDCVELTPGAFDNLFGALAGH